MLAGEGGEWEAQLQMLEDEDWERREGEKESLIEKLVLQTTFR